MKSKQTFSREYKLAAVKKIDRQRLSYSEVAKDLGVNDGLLRNWRKKFEAEGVPSVASASTAEEELKPLREENRRLKMEREILIKATAFFANPNGGDSSSSSSTAPNGRFSSNAKFFESAERDITAGENDNDAKDLAVVAGLRCCQSCMQIRS